jgi:hypothetical protein
VIEEDWSEMMTLNLRFQISDELRDLESEWHCAEGITTNTMI